MLYGVKINYSVCIFGAEGTCEAMTHSPVTHRATIQFYGAEGDDKSLVHPIIFVRGCSDSGHNLIRLFPLLYLW